MKQEMSTPCPECPFRSDREPFLRAARAREIAFSVLRGESFPCHKTTDVDEDDEGNEIRRNRAREQQCAGAEIFCAKQGGSSQLSRIAERLGLPVADLDLRAPVFDSAEEFEEAQSDFEAPEGEACSVANYLCSAPAGFRVGGGIVSGSPTLGDGDCCFRCGDYVCSSRSCSRELDEGRACAYCVEEIEEEEKN